MRAVLLSLGWDKRTLTFQLSCFYCICGMVFVLVWLSVIMSCYGIFLELATRNFHQYMAIRLQNQLLGPWPLGPS